MASRPWMKMYPGDWRRHAGVQSCSLAARGLWHELLMVMHECEPYGRLRTGGKIPDLDTIARLVGSKPRDVKLLLAELEAADVFSRDADGAIFSRRMVKDEKARQDGIASGVLGGNPALVKERQTHNGQANGSEHSTLKGVDNAPPDTRARARADSDSDSDPGSSSSGQRAAEPRVVKSTHAFDLGALIAGTCLDTPAAKDAIGEWLAYKRERKQGYTERGTRALISKLATWGPAEAEAAIRSSMANNWAGLFEQAAGTNGRAKVEPKGFQGMRDYLAMTEANRERSA